MLKKITSKAKGLFKNTRATVAAAILTLCSSAAMAQHAAGNYLAGTQALGKVTEELVKYVPYVVKLCYSIAGIVAVVGAISVYIAMNNLNTLNTLIFNLL